MYIALMGTTQQGSGPAPLSLSLDVSFVEIFINTESSIFAEEGEISIAATASGGTPPYSYSWVNNRETDDDNAFTLNMGTTNEGKWADAIITTTYQAHPRL